MMNELENISTKQLEIELEQRRKREKEGTKPKQVENPNWMPLREICQEYINCLDSEEYCDDDFSHYIYETALRALFGKNVFDWVNKQKG